MIKRTIGVISLINFNRPQDESSQNEVRYVKWEPSVLTIMPYLISGNTVNFTFVFAEVEKNYINSLYQDELIKQKKIIED